MPVTNSDELRERKQITRIVRDNEISWIDWTLAEKHSDIHRFTKMIIEFRKNHHILNKGHFFSGAVIPPCTTPDISWHGELPDTPSWDEDNHLIACLISGEYTRLSGKSAEPDIFIIF